MTAVNRVFVRGDTHSDFEWLPAWCEENKTTREDILFILGDSGLLYYGEKSWREKNLKKFVSSCPITIYCVRGNHESRPNHYSSMIFEEWESDPIIASGAYYEPEYPNIYYIADGSTFSINKKRFLCIGGAASIDKEYRIMMGLRWFPDEELTQEEMLNILDKVDYQYFDYILTHTCPEEWQPFDLFIKSIDQSKISKRMEYFLSTVSRIVGFREWWFGHFHDNRINIEFNKLHPGQGQISMLFDEIRQIM